MTRTVSIVVVTGMSGAGRSTALHVLEDLGYYCIDNLPPPMLATAVSVCVEVAGQTRIGLGMDVRARGFLESADDEIEKLRARGEPMKVLFLDAEESVLVRRYSETRRPHPLSSEYPDEAIAALIARERERLVDLRARADQVLDSSRLNAHEFRRQLVGLFAGDGELSMNTRLMSFGFKHGSPSDADLLFDVRHLPNPHFVPELRPRSGKDPAVSSYVLDRPEGRSMLDALETFLLPLLPQYAKEGKVVLTVAIGCTGGRHRSVAIVEALAHRLSAKAPEVGVGEVTASHRDIDRGG
jgi:UPF0042 nucleotide-binding protein